MSSGRVFLVAAEPSGDALAADLIAALKKRDADLQFAGVGGAAMASEGVQSPFDIKDLAILGLIEGLLAYKRVVAYADQAAAAAIAFAPDVVVLVDSWGFTLRVGQRLKGRIGRGRLVKYIGPQVWATRPGRARTLAGVVDHLICIHDFEAPFYAPFGLACTICGHPAIGRHQAGDAAAFRTRHGLAPDQRVLLVLPGSRRSELDRVAPILAEAGRCLAAARPDVKLVYVAAAGWRSAVEALASGALVIDAAEKDDAFAAATVALAASGTVTTELALHGAPVVVGYKVGWITWAIARAFLFKARFATLMNVAADAEIVPEFLQTKFTADNIAAAGARLLDDPAARAAQIAAQNAALDAMGRGGRPAADIAADVVLAEMALSR